MRGQCGDDVLRMLVTGGPPVRGGGGMPRAASISSTMRGLNGRSRLPERRQDQVPRGCSMAEYPESLFFILAALAPTCFSCAHANELN
jgi:hypothetical protein